MSKWFNYHVVLGEEPILLDTEVVQEDPELYKACSIANLWIEKILDDGCNKPDNDAIMEFL